MATVEYIGPYLPGYIPAGYGSSSKIYEFGGHDSGYWHGGPTMVCGGYLTAQRVGGTITGNVTGGYNILRPGSSYPDTITVSVNFISDDGTVNTEIASEESPSGGNWSDFTFTDDFSITTNLAGTIVVYYTCRSKWRLF